MARRLLSNIFEVNGLTTRVCHYLQGGDSIAHGDGDTRARIMSEGEEEAKEEEGTSRQLPELFHLPTIHLLLHDSSPLTSPVTSIAK